MIAQSVIDRWRKGDLVGDSKHALVVRIRRGYLNRKFGGTVLGGDITHINAQIEGDTALAPWQATWTPNGPWITLPNVQSAKYTKSFDQKGSSSLTVVMDNIAFPEKTGALGRYHEITRGFYSPSRTPSGHSSFDWSLWDDTGWTDVLNGGYQIELWEGYGEGDDVVPLQDPVFRDGWTCQPASGLIDRTWVGLIDDVECESRPDQITITARDFGLLWTDQHLMGLNKPSNMRAPVTFADQKRTKTQVKNGTLQDCQGWVLTSDAADVVECLFVWLGFKEWIVKRYGWRLFNPMQYGSAKHFSDVLDDMLAQGNYVMHMASPTAWDRSIGVPHFERQTAGQDTPMGLTEINESMMLETAQLKWDLSNLPYVFRYRGVPAPKEAGGATFEDSLVTTYMAAFYPPWSGQVDWVLGPPKGGNHPDGVHELPNRVSSVRRHFMQNLGIGLRVGLDSNYQCLVACVLAALQYGLQECVGQIQVPGLPGFELNGQVKVIDEGVGINSRLWLAQIESDHTTGENGKWTMTLGGSYLDHEDWAQLMTAYDTITTMEAG